MSTLYFYDDPRTKNSMTLSGIHGMKVAIYREKFPEHKPIRNDGYTFLVGFHDTILYPVSRKIHYKKSATPHTCSMRCMSAKPCGSCECQCGGVNHGRGY